MFCKCFIISHCFGRKSQKLSCVWVFFPVHDNWPLSKLTSVGCRIKWSGKSFFKFQSAYLALKTIGFSVLSRDTAQYIGVVRGVVKITSQKNFLISDDKILTTSTAQDQFYCKNLVPLFPLSTNRFKPFDSVQLATLRFELSQQITEKKKLF